jgi:hypothetical protein
MSRVTLERVVELTRTGVPWPHVPGDDVEGFEPLPAASEALGCGATLCIRLHLAHRALLP